MDFDSRAKFISLEDWRNEFRRTVDGRAKFISPTTIRQSWSTCAANLSNP